MRPLRIFESPSGARYVVVYESREGMLRLRRLYKNRPVLYRTMADLNANGWKEVTL